MDNDLNFMVKRVVAVTLLFSIVAMIIGYVTAGIKGVVAAIAGALFSAGGFYISTVVLVKALKEDRSSFFPILLNLGKALVTGGVGAWFFLQSPRAGLMFLLGFILIFPSLISFARVNERRNPYIPPEPVEEQVIEVEDEGNEEAAEEKVVETEEKEEKEEKEKEVEVEENISSVSEDEVLPVPESDAGQDK